jgi:DNA-binding response OmpR family regulator
MENVLIIEDDLTMLRGLKDNFEFKGYRVSTASDAEQGLRRAVMEAPDLVILDIMLPDMNGFEVCGMIRDKGLDMPIIVVTARDEESDIMLGLRVGADDYVTKPFSVGILLARVEAFLRRKNQAQLKIYEFGNCRLNTNLSTVTRDGQQFCLSPSELRMLLLFLRRAGSVLTKDELLTSVWGYSHFISLRDVEGFVRRLRNKIEPDPIHPTFIRTIRDIGYMFDAPKSNGNSAHN